MEAFRNPPRAILADDEPLLLEGLRRELKALWPDLQIVGTARNGQEALEMIELEQPNVAFLDIRMPLLNGLEVAQELVDRKHTQPQTEIVFVTAYGEYATEAFEMAAIDYLLKPVTSTRLAKTIDRLKEKLISRELESAVPANPPVSQDLLAQLQSLVTVRPGLFNSIEAAAPTAKARLKQLRVAVGESVRLVPVDEVLYFQAADKYVIVMMADREYLVRESLRELLQQLDPEQFEQIHRSTVVNTARISEVIKDEFGRQFVKFIGHNKAVAVSRVYAHLFKAM